MPQPYPATVFLFGTRVPARDVRAGPYMSIEFLKSALDQFRNALSECRKTPMKLRLWERGGALHCTAWPDQGAQHTAACPFDIERKRFVPKIEALKVGQDERATLRYAALIAGRCI